MQLTRDIGYAVKILYCVKEEVSVSKENSVTLSEISVRARLSRNIAKRICDTLVRNNLLAISHQKEKAYLLINKDETITMLDVIRAFKVQTDPFVLFDKEFDYSFDQSIDFSEYHREIEDIYRRAVIILPIG